MSEEPSPRLLIPSILAGPLVLLFGAAEAWAQHIPNPLELDIGDLLGGLVFLPLAATIGLLPALFLNAVGSFVLIKLGTLFPLLRFPLFWALAGGLLSWSIIWWLEFPDPMIFSFTAAGTVCALICRLRLA